MRKVINNISKVSPVLIIILILTAMTVSGFNAAERVFSYENTTEAEAVTVEETRLESGPPSPDELPGNMDSEGKPNPEQTAYLSAAGFASSIELQKRIKSQRVIQSFDAIVSYDKSNQHKIRSSIFLVSTDVGLQFTLVGSKPSGTS